MPAVTPESRRGAGEKGSKTTFTRPEPFATLAAMLKSFLPVLGLPLLLAGCATEFTNLTPQQQEKAANNRYTVELALDSKRQTVRWDSIRPAIIIGQQSFPMHPTALMTNRWEAEIELPPGTDIVHYQYKVDFEYNAFGKPKEDSTMSPAYMLRVVPAQPAGK